MFQADVLKQVVNGFEEDTDAKTALLAFAETMLEPMILRYSLYPAKGTTIKHYAHNSDQMMLTHILNGLFPTLTLIHEAQKRKLSRLSRLGVDEIKLYMLAYTMHDLDKILGDNANLSTLTMKGVEAAREELLVEIEKINARAFFPALDDWSGEILWLAVNTQRSRDINLSHSTFVSQENVTRITDEILEAVRPQMMGFRRAGIESTLRDLCTYSDLIAFCIKSPEEALSSNVATRPSGILDLLRQLTDNGPGRYFTLAYHKLTEVRGLLSNHINNAALRYVQKLYPQEQEPLIPYLYFPNGVVYLDSLNRAAPAINRAELNAVVEEEIKEACGAMIQNGDGFGFNHLGRLKYPRYFHDFLNLEQFLNLFARRTLSESKINVAESTLNAMKEMQAAGNIPLEIALDYVPSERIAMLGRFLINYMDILYEYLGKTASPLREELESRLKARFGQERWNNAVQIPSSGGVDYRFYWLAAQFLEANPLADYEEKNPGGSLEGLFKELIDEMLQIAGKELAAAPGLQGQFLQDLSDYLSKNLFFGLGAIPRVEFLPDFAAEFSGYGTAKRKRSSQLTCTICNSEYPTSQQEDAAVLFQPWVYKNRLSLYKSENAGGICSICSLELMLRQLLLTDKPGEQSRMKVTGKDYEDMELKYFFLYPGFFFTNQTYRLMHYIIRQMQNLRLYEVCERLRDKERIGTDDILSLSFFNLKPIDEKTMAKLQKEEQKKEGQEEKGKMYLFERYEKKQYPGFIFFGKKTFSKKKKGTGDSTKATLASWVEAAWLGMALPLITGSRVVVTESYLPLYNSSADFLETVVLDAPHQSIRHLLPSSLTRLRLDQLYGHRVIEGDWLGGMMAAFSRAIELHIDTERTGADLKLERFSRIARDLASDQLFVFSFLREQLRRDKLDRISGAKASHYNDIYHLFVNYYHSTEGVFMSNVATRHERITEQYLQFYLPFNDKKKWPTSHAIVRPIDIAAKSIIKDTLNLNAEEIKLEMVAAIKAWLEIVRKKGATGIVVAPRKDLSQLVRQFVETFYNEIFMGYAEGQRSVLNSRLNRLKHACEEVFAMRMQKTISSIDEQQTENTPADITMEESLTDSDIA